MFVPGQQTVKKASQSLRQGPGLLEIRPRHIPRRLRRDVAAARATVLTGLTRLASCYPTRVKVIATG